MNKAPDLRTFAGKLRELSQMNRLAAEVQRAGEEARRRAMAEVPVSTGATKRSAYVQYRTQTTVNGVPYQAVSRVGFSAPWANILESGAKPHLIKAVNTPMLSFFWEKAARWVEFKQVNHPGFAPRPYLGPAGLAAFRDMSSRILRTIQGILRR